MSLGYIEYINLLIKLTRLIQVKRTGFIGIILIFFCVNFRLIATLSIHKKKCVSTKGHYIPKTGFSFEWSLSIRNKLLSANSI